MAATVNINGSNWPNEVPNTRFGIWCGGKRHVIRFRDKRLTLLNHPDLKRELILAEFGSGCPCVEVLLAWRRRNTSVIAAHSRKMVQFFVNWRCRPRQYRCAEPVHTGCASLEHRYQLRLEKIIHELLRTQCNYLAPRYFDFYTRVFTEHRSPHLQLCSCQLTTSIEAVYRFCLPNNWLSQIWAKGLAVIDGLLTLELLPDGQRLAAVECPLPGLPSYEYNLTTEIRPLEATNDKT